MYSVVEFIYADNKIGIALAHNDWFQNNEKTSILCPPSSWDKTAKEWNPKKSTLKWKSHKCRVLSENLGK